MDRYETVSVRQSHFETTALKQASLVVLLFVRFIKVVYLDDILINDTDAVPPHKGIIKGN